MLKNLIRNLFQKLLGFDRYLFVFSLINILRIKWGLSEKAFRYFLSLSDADGVILDIGANIGSMTVVMASRYPAAMIYSFEPIPANRKALERVVKFFDLKNVRVFENALGDTDGMVNMIIPVSGNSKMHGWSHVKEAGQSDKGEIYSIPMKQMDTMHEMIGLPKITAMKIDVENFEYFVLKGGRNLLEKHRPLVLCELWNNERFAPCLSLMKELGYEVKIYDGKGLINFTDQTALDFFFLPKKKNQRH